MLYKSILSLSVVTFSLLSIIQNYNVVAIDGIRDRVSDGLSLDAAKATWFVKDPKTDVVCILFQGGIRIARNGSLIDVPTQARASGSCGSEIQKLNLDWESPEEGTNNLTLTFVDIRDRYIFPVSKTSYVLESINGNLYSIDKKEQISFDIKEGMIHYYIDMESSCYTQDVIQSIEDKVEVQFLDVRLEAFHSSKDFIFSFSSGTCFGSNASLSLFLMSLMCAALIVVIIILVIILIGRNSILGRRNSIEGYSRI